MSRGYNRSAGFGAREGQGQNRSNRFETTGMFVGSDEDKVGKKLKAMGYTLNFEGSDNLIRSALDVTGSNVMRAVNEIVQRGLIPPQHSPKEVAKEKANGSIMEKYWQKAGQEQSDKLQELRREAESLADNVRMANDIRQQFYQYVIDGLPPKELETKLNEAIDYLKNGPKFKFVVENTKGFGAKENTATAAKPPLLAEGYMKNTDSFYPMWVGPRAAMASGKSLPEIKKMIVSDFRSSEAKDLGFLKVEQARTRRSYIDLKIKTDLEVPQSLRDNPARRAMVNSKAQRWADRSGLTEEERRYADRVDELRTNANKIADAYNFNADNAQIDYFHSRYSSGVILTDKNGEVF